MIMMLIESPKNEKIKYLTRLLTDNRFRRREQVFTVEGRQENERALQFHFKAKEFFICPDIFDGEMPAGQITFVSKNLYEKLAYRGTSEGCLGIYETVKPVLSDFAPAAHSAVVVLEGVEKPGNLGAILRSCEAFGIDALIITDPKTDFYNPNVIRSSVGCLFGMNIFQSSNEDTFSFLSNNGYQILTTNMHHDAQPLPARTLAGKTAIVFGTEHSGLTDFWTGKGHNTLIPMAGSIDSLNLSNAVAIAAYEILRQRI